MFHYKIVGKYYKPGLRLLRQNVAENSNSKKRCFADDGCHLQASIQQTKTTEDLGVSDFSLWFRNVAFRRQEII